MAGMRVFITTSHPLDASPVFAHRSGRAGRVALPSGSPRGWYVCSRASLALPHRATAAASLELEGNGRRMKITCQACQAKYTIADEKVVGKIVKIRCKKCGATIVVNSSDSSAGSSPPGPGGAFDYAPEGTAQASWMVNVADGDQRTMTEQEIAAAYRAGVVGDDTFCWRDGMGDWQPIEEIALLHAACMAAGRAEGAPAPAHTSNRPATRDGNGTPAGPPPTATTAARRAGGRAAAADLFGGAAQAGGEDEVMTSAPAAASQGHSEGQKPTGARNENSLLFALQEKGATPPPPTMTATTEASGLIDIRQLGAQMRSSADEKKKSRVDDIMNLGGGAFSPSLAAPVLSAPSLEHYSQPPPGMLSSPAAAQVKNTALIILVACLGIFSLVAAGGIVWLLAGGKAPVIAEDHAKPGASASAAAVTTTPTGSVALNAAPSASGPTTAQTATAAPSEAPSAAASEAANAPPAASAPKETPTKEVMPPKEPKVAAVVAPKEPAAPPPAPPAAAEFNMGEVRARLASVAAGVQSCKRGDTVGSGRVEITFGPSGTVQTATLMPGSPFDGTPTGKCVEARFRQARVPAFSGSPVAVAKSFNIN